MRISRAELFSRNALGQFLRVLRDKLGVDALHAPDAVGFRIRSESGPAVREGVDTGERKCPVVLRERAITGLRQIACAKAEISRSHAYLKKKKAEKTVSPYDSNFDS